MPKSPFLRLFLTAATVTAVAAACTFIITWSPVHPGGWGVPLAKWSEVWSQRALPGGWPVDFVEPSWKSEESLGSYGHIRYDGRPHGAFHVCLPFAVFSLGVGLVAAAAHICLSWCVVRLRRHSESALTLAIQSVRWAAWVPLFTCAVYWLWAGAARGSISQRIVGQTYVEVAFGPFGRAAVLLGGVALYLAVVMWTARRGQKDVERQTPESRPRSSHWLPTAVAVASALLTLFPYWGCQSLRLVSPTTAIKIGQWSEATPLRGILDRVAPLP